MQSQTWDQPGLDVRLICPFRSRLSAFPVWPLSPQLQNKVLWGPEHPAFQGWGDEQKRREIEST